MEIKLLSDTRVGAIFLAIMFLFPIDTGSGYSIVFLNLMDIHKLSYGYLYLLVGLITALVVSNLVVYIYDKRTGKADIDLIKKKEKELEELKRKAGKKSR